MVNAITRTLKLISTEPKPAVAPLPKKSEFCERFVARMVSRFKFTHFEDGCSVEEYARDAALAYYALPEERCSGPEECADFDIRNWNEE